MKWFEADFPDRLVSLLSYTASDWHTLGIVPPRSLSDEPIQIFFKFTDPPPAYGEELLAQITTRLSSPYLDDDWIHSAWIIASASEEQAEVVMTLDEDLYEGAATIHYTLWSKNKADVFQGGWYPYSLETVWKVQ